MLTLSEPVTVTGTPTLALNNGGTATYAGGSGGDILTFKYTVGLTDSTVSALAVTAIGPLNGAEIKDVAGNTANLFGRADHIQRPGCRSARPTCIASLE